MSTISTPTTFLTRSNRTPVQTAAAVPWIEVVGKLGVCVAAVLVVVLAWLNQSHVQAARILLSHPAGQVFAAALTLYGSFSFFWTMWRLWLAIRYRPVPTVAFERLPRITVVVPAYNEGALVGRTIRHLAKADYPAGRLEIIVVDDGSCDDTWEHIRAAAEEVGPMVTALHFEENRGKRWALWEGFRRAKGDIFVTVDSDSLIAPDALPALISPLVVDSTVGAVAGNVTVLNRTESIIPQMLAVRYVMTFDYKRAAQSMMGKGAVLCCAGALAAYRRSAVMPILDRWLNQTYLGGHARAGEDHAMTNFILKQGFNVRYQRTAQVWTKSPTSYTGLCKMFLRWGRSNVRETIHTGNYVFKRFHGGRHAGIRFNFLMCAFGLWLPYPLLFASLALSFVMPMIFGLKMLAACVLGSFFTMGFFAVRERSTHCVFAVVYAFYAMILLCWVWPYALLTSHKSVWMTRNKQAVPGQRRPLPPRERLDPLDLPAVEPAIPQFMPAYAEAAA